MTGTNVLSAGSDLGHIGPKRHVIRNLILVLGVAVSAVLIGWLQIKTRALEDPAIVELEQFRLALYNQCDDPRFRDPLTSEMATIYKQQNQLRPEVIRQYHLLQRGQASCQEVVESLRSGGYPLP